jgi:hypothetical protein
MRNKKQDWLISICIFLISFSVLILINPGKNTFSSVDSAHFYSSIEEFNLSKEQPHLPGYILYVYSLKAIDSLFPGDFYSKFIGTKYYSIIFLSSLFTSFSLLILFHLFRNWLGWKKSILLVIAVFSVPQVLFYGSNAENYSIDLFFSSLVLLLAFKEKYFKYIIVVISIAAGFRQSFALFVLSVYLFHIFLKLKNKEYSLKSLIIPFGIALLICLIWLLPLLNNAGGLFAYLELFSKLDTTPKSGIFENLISLISFNLLFFISFLISFSISFFKNFNFKNFFKNPTKFDTFFFIQVFISFSLTIFIGIHYNKGYFLILIPAIFVYIIKWFKEDRIKSYQIFIFIILNFVLFFFTPYRFPSSETSIEKNLRTKSSVEIQIERLFGNYLTTYNLEKSYKRNIENLISIIDSASSKDSIFNFYIFPSCQVDPKILKVIFSSSKKSFNSKFIKIESIKLDSNRKIKNTPNLNIDNNSNIQFGIILPKDQMKYLNIEKRSMKFIEMDELICLIIDFNQNFINFVE